MPNVHGQVTREDFVAPTGQLRIMKQDGRDGGLKIMGDFHNRHVAVKVVEGLRELKPEHTFTLYDEEGNTVSLPLEDEPMSEAAIQEMVVAVAASFRSFGGGKTVPGNPIAHALQNRPPQFAASVDIEDVGRFILGQPSKTVAS